MAIMLLGSVVQLRGQRRQLCGRQRLARATEDCEEYRVHSEDLPRDVADGEVDIVQIAHSQFLGALIDFAEDLGQEGRQRVTIEVRGNTAGHHQAVRQDWKSTRLNSS